MSEEEIPQEFEIRVYPVKGEDGEWVMGVFRKNHQRLVVRPLIYNDRMMAAESAQVLARMSNMSVRECRECQDLSFDYELVIVRRLVVKAVVYGGLLFLAYFLAVKFL